MVTTRLDLVVYLLILSSMLKRQEMDSPIKSGYDHSDNKSEDDTSL
jgi:hypothetical protein